MRGLRPSLRRAVPSLFFDPDENIRDLVRNTTKYIPPIRRSTPEEEQVGSPLDIFRRF